MERGQWRGRRVGRRKRRARGRGREWWGGGVLRVRRGVGAVRQRNRVL
ncbi:MAG: hypothetical protein QW379_06825 [Thermoplasmata archaeon]